MADQDDHLTWTEISRRDVLRRLLSIPLHLGVLSAIVLQVPRGISSSRTSGNGQAPAGGPAPAADSPIARGLYPRTLLTPEILVQLRRRIVDDASTKTRWQAAVSQFESKKSTWNTKPKDQYAAVFAAFLLMVRRPNDDLGLTWADSWQSYRDRVLAAAGGWARTGPHSQTAIATALTYDCLYNDLTAPERAKFEEWVELGYKENGWLGAGVEVWDNGASDDHAAKLFCALVSSSAKARFAEAYARTLEIADANDWMGFGFGLGREWHEGYPSRHGLPMELYALKHAGGSTDAATIDHFLVHLRDTWQLTAEGIIPHPSASAMPGTYWTSDKFHTQDPIKGFHRALGVGAHMVWALAVLPGKLNLDGVGASDRPKLAKDETSYLGYLRTVWDEANPRSRRQLREVVDVTRLGRAPSNEQAKFWAFPAWLIHNARERPMITATDAAIPHVRRYWPGTLEWTFINSPDFSRDKGSVIRYTHRRYGASNYEEGTKQNGRWHVHRDGPLLIQRGETGHGVNTRKSLWCANGTIGFVDPNAYPLFTFSGKDEGDNGGIRNFVSRNTRDEILAEPTADFGPVTAWHADEHCVAITSDLTRSYNSTQVQVGPPKANERKISSFIREFVVIKRGGDGTDREKVFTYDRIQLLDTKFEPRYYLCPAAEPDIDGAEREVLPWGPPKEDANFDWYASGPTHWDYEKATRLIYANDKEPKAPIPGKGKVCVTWLQPSGAAVRIRKAGGTNAVSKVKARLNGHPFFSPWRGWSGKDEWAGVSRPDERAYVGLYTVTVTPAVVNKDTRFLMACEVMNVSDSPGTAEMVRCDEGSVAARCGASAVVFAKESSVHRAGVVNIPSGVTLVVFVNLPPGEDRTLTPGAGLTIITANRKASADASAAGLKNSYGHLAVGVQGSGTLTFS